MSSKTVAEAEELLAQSPIRIVVVDDHLFMRDLISATLNRQSAQYTVLAAVGTAAEAIEACGKLTPDLLILDINLPDQSGIDIVPMIKDMSPDTHVLLCTAYANPERISDAFRAGAKGFVEKTNTWDDFLGAVDRVGRGEQYFSSRTSGVKPLSRAELPQRRKRCTGILSPREQEVLRLIAEGGTSKEIATSLFISVATVETHRTNLMSKLGVRNVAGLVLHAFQHGMVETGASASSANARPS